MAMILVPSGVMMALPETEPVVAQWGKVMTSVLADRLVPGAVVSSA